MDKIELRILELYLRIFLGEDEVDFDGVEGVLILELWRMHS